MLLQKHGSGPSGGDIALADCHHAQSVVSHTHKLTMTDIDHRCHSLAMSWWVYSHTLDMQMPWHDTNGHLVFACACSYVSACPSVSYLNRGKAERGEKKAHSWTRTVCQFAVCSGFQPVYTLCSFYSGTGWVPCSIPFWSHDSSFWP